MKKAIYGFLFCSLALPTAHANNASGIGSVSEIAACFESFLLKEVAKDDFYTWEHKPEYWPAMRRVFAGWLRNSPGSNHYAELIFDSNGILDSVRCNLNQNDAANYGRCTTLVENGSVRLRWFWYDLPSYKENAGQYLEFAKVTNSKVECLAR